MVKFTIDKKQYNLPLSWKELTVRQFIELREWKDGNFVKLLSILTRVHYETLFNTKQIDVDEKLIPFMRWIDTPPKFDSWSMPSQISIDGKKYDNPKYQGYFTFGQKIELQKRLIKVAAESNNTIDCIAFALAVYYQPIIDSKTFDSLAAEKLSEQMLDCNLGEAYPIANFFLKRSVASQNVIQPFLRVNRIKSRRLLGLVNWMFSKSSPRSTVLPMVTSLNTK